MINENNIYIMLIAGLFEFISYDHRFWLLLVLIQRHWTKFVLNITSVLSINF